MDAVKFIEEARRMCQTYNGREERCPANYSVCANCRINITHNTDATDAVKIVEEWSAEHPRKTRQDVFLEQYPEADLDPRGVLSICPIGISAAHRDSDGGCKNPYVRCDNCRREFWMQEVE